MWIEAFCEYPFSRVRLTCEGNVAFCCFMRPDPDPDEFKKKQPAYIGNVLEDSFDNIWFGDKAEEIREFTHKGKLHPMCQCPGCPILPLKKPYPNEHIVFNEHPNFLEIDLPNTHCNVGGLNPDPVTSPACIMCERSDPFFKPEEDHLMEVMDKIKHIVPNLHQIHIQGIAEPFYETREKGHLLFDVLDVLNFDEYKDQITLSVTTNATIFKKRVREEYLKRVPNSITNFSVDAATPKTFKAIRIFDCFEKVLANMKSFDEERNYGKQFIRIHNNINIMNVHEVREMVKIGHDIRAEYVEFNPTNGFNHKILVNEENCGLFNRAQQDIEDEAEKLGQPIKFIRDLDLGLSDQLVQLTL